jgi:hypothetical protein
MTNDAYTKVVLTIIAGCLVWMCAHAVTPTARAQAERPAPTPVILVDAGGRPLVTSQGLPVEITNASLAVAVQSIERGPAWDPIQVRVMPEPPSLTPVP